MPDTRVGERNLQENSAVATEEIGLLTAVTCPTFRYHPAIVAQAAATVSVMTGARFRLGLGSGERLNEHVIGGGWPAPSVRQDRFEEAIEVIRMLFEADGEECSHRGEFFEVDRARLFDRPEQPPQILVAAGGPRAARIAADKGDGLIATEPDRELTQAYRDAGGEGPRCAEIGLCWAESADEALATMYRYYRWSQFDWNVLLELATTRAFEAASKGVSRDDFKEIPHGPDVECYVDAIRRYLEAGFDELILHQVGPEQDGFLNFFAGELGTALRESARRYEGAGPRAD